MSEGRLGAEPVDVVARGDELVELALELVGLGAELVDAAADAAQRRLGGGGGIGEVDRRLRSFTLTEQHPLLPRRISPVLHELVADRGHVRIAAGPPEFDALPHIVDEAVLLTTLTGDIEEIE